MFIPGRPSQHSSTAYYKDLFIYIKKCAIIPSTQSKKINRQKRKRMLLIEWKMHFRTFIFMEHIWSIKENTKSQYESHFQQKVRGGEKKRKERNHQFEIDTLVLSEYANLICNDTVPSVFIPEPHPCTPDDRVLVLQWWSRCVHTQFVQFCMNKVYTNATSQYKGYITYSLQTRSWLKRPFGNHPRCKRDYCTRNWIKVAWNLTAEITVDSDY